MIELSFHHAGMTPGFEKQYKRVKRRKKCRKKSTITTTKIDEDIEALQISQ